MRGRLPDRLPDTLEALLFDRSEFGGTLPEFLPPALKVLRAAHTPLEGKLPDQTRCVGNEGWFKCNWVMGVSELQELDVSGTLVGGKLPPLAHLKNMERLSKKVKTKQTKSFLRKKTQLFEKKDTTKCKCRA